LGALWAFVCIVSCHADYSAPHHTRRLPPSFSSVLRLSADPPRAPSLSRLSLFQN